MNVIKTPLTIGLMLLLLVVMPGLADAKDHPYVIQFPGTDAEVRFTSVYNLDQRGNTFYTKDGGAAIVFKFDVKGGAKLLEDWVVHTFH